MKKYIKLYMLFISILFITGCVNINTSNIDTIINNTLNSKYNMYNHTNDGFKYYLPRGLRVVSKSKLNETIKSDKNDYYLYVDLISYFNKIELKYTKKDNIYYSELIKDKGIINITKLEEDYLIHIDYNYAQIEVKAKESDIKTCVSNAIIIITSIIYNDDTIKTMMDDDILSINEKEVDVFNVKDTGQRDYLEVDEGYIEEEEYDPDIIN